MLMFAPNKDSIPVLQPFDAKAIYDASNTKRELIERSVCRLFGIHPVLMGYTDAAVLGNQQALSNAVALLNNKINSFQRHISSAFNELFGEDYDFTISTFTPYQFIAPELFAVLTEDEKRATGGYSPIERSIPTEGDKILEVLNGLSPLLATKVIELIPKQTLLDALGIKAELETTQTTQDVPNQ